MYSFKVIEYSTRSEKFFLSPRATRTHHYHFGLAAFAWELLVRHFVWAEQNVFFLSGVQEQLCDQKLGNEPIYRHGNG